MTRRLRIRAIADPACIGAPIGARRPKAGQRHRTLWGLAPLASLLGSTGHAQKAKYDWHMPQRFGTRRAVAGATGTDSILDFHWDTLNLSYRYDPEYVNPKAWQVELDGCASTDAKQFTWRITDTVKKSTTTFGPFTKCSTAASVPRLGFYPVTLVVSNGTGIDSLTRTIHVNDLLIVSLGESYSSGEGNPDIPQSGVAIDYVPFPGSVTARLRVAHRPVWQDRRCDRSGWAGPAQAALDVAHSDPARHVSVTFLSFACAGAKISDGLLLPYKGEDTDGLPRGAAPLPPQLDQLAVALCGASSCKGRVKSRSIDDLLISAGGNDLGFGDIATSCAEIDLAARHGMGAPLGDIAGELAGLFTFCSGDTSVTAPVKRRLDSVLPARYDSLAHALSGDGKDLIDRSTLVFITEYPDPSHDRDGNPCGYPPPSPASILEIPVVGPTIDGRTANWVADTLIPRLNSVVEQAAGTHHWHYVTGIASAFRQHGMCAGPARWFRTFDEALVLQRPIDFTFAPFTVGGARVPSGTLHPNTQGHRVYADQLLRAMGHDPSVRPVLSVDAPQLRAGLQGTITVHFTHPQRGPVAGRARIDDGAWFATNSPHVFTLHGAVHHVVVEASDYATQAGLFHLPLRQLTVHFAPDPLPGGGPFDLKVFAVNDSGRHIDGLVRIYQPVAGPGSKAEELVVHTDSTLKGFVAKTRTVRLRNRQTGDLAAMTLGPGGEVFPIDPDYASAEFSLVQRDQVGDADSATTRKATKVRLANWPPLAVPVTRGVARLTKQ